jgi:hypothetical protein
MLASEKTKMRVCQGFFEKSDSFMWNHSDPKNPLSPAIVVCSSKKVSFLFYQ